MELIGNGLCACRCLSYVPQLGKIVSLMNNTFFKRHVFDVLAFLALCAIVVGSLTPAPEDPMVQTNDKIIHFVAYGTLAFLAVMHRPSVRTTIYAIMAVILAGGIIELLQPLVGRDNNWGDILANTAGACIGGLAAILARRLVLMRSNIST